MQTDCNPALFEFHPSEAAGSVRQVVQSLQHLNGGILGRLVRAKHRIVEAHVQSSIDPHPSVTPYDGIPVSRQQGVAVDDGSREIDQYRPAFRLADAIRVAADNGISREVQ